MHFILEQVVIKIKPLSKGNHQILGEYQHSKNFANILRRMKNASDLNEVAEAMGSFLDAVEGWKHNTCDICGNNNRKQIIFTNLKLGWKTSLFLNTRGHQKLGEL